MIQGLKDGGKKFEINIEKKGVELTMCQTSLVFSKYPSCLLHFVSTNASRRAYVNRYNVSYPVQVHVEWVYLFHALFFQAVNIFKAMGFKWKSYKLKDYQVLSECSMSRK